MSEILTQAFILGLLATTLREGMTIDVAYLGRINRVFGRDSAMGLDAVATTHPVVQKVETDTVILCAIPPFPRDPEGAEAINERLEERDRRD